MKIREEPQPKRAQEMGSGVNMENEKKTSNNMTESTPKTPQSAQETQLNWVNIRVNTQASGVNPGTPIVQSVHASIRPANTQL